MTTKNKEKTVTKTMKYRIKYNKDLYRIIDNVQYHAHKVRNLTTSMAYDWQNFSFSYNTRFGEYHSEKKLLGKTLLSDIYNKSKRVSERIYTKTVQAYIIETINIYNRQIIDNTKGILHTSNRLRKSSFLIKSQLIINVSKVDSKTYHVALSLVYKEYVKKWKEVLKEINERLLNVE